LKLGRLHCTLQAGKREKVISGLSHIEQPPKGAGLGQVPRTTVRKEGAHRISLDQDHLDLAEVLVHCPPPNSITLKAL
jgi:hypothetical protein